MKKLLTLLAIIVAFSACRKNGTGINNNVSCWQCAIEGNYNGKLVDIDTGICNMTQTQINEFMAPHNKTEEVVSCKRSL